MPRRPRTRPLHDRGGARCRWWSEPEDRYRAHGRVERFVEPALLLVLSDGQTHGYDLAEHIEELTGERVDLGNLYRLLRTLEDEDMVVSKWRDDQPGRAKRVYRITPEGRLVLDAWADALRDTQQTVRGFLRRYDERTK
jgi:poly-beta-hydroxybutyrate-responsive repressor